MSGYRIFNSNRPFIRRLMNTNSNFRKVNNRISQQLNKFVGKTWDEMHSQSF